MTQSPARPRTEAALSSVADVGVQKGLSVADLNTDPSRTPQEGREHEEDKPQDDGMTGQDQLDQLDDAQLDDSLSPEHYDASTFRSLAS